MLKYLVTFSMLSCMILGHALQAEAQVSEKKINAIVEEGKRIYRSEMASWYGTDLFLANYSNRENIGGYFSYENDNQVHCLFFSREEDPKVLGRISFDSTYNVDSAKVDIGDRAFTPVELEFYDIRKKAIEKVQSDTIVMTFENTNLNFIPIIQEKEKRVYILTGPQIQGVVLLGNDYLISFNAKDEVKEIKKLHANLIPLETEVKDDEHLIQTSSIHSHLPETGDLITPTDVATLMLYAPYTSWETHNVISEKYLSIWNCETNTLNVTTTKAVEKILQDK